MKKEINLHVKLTEEEAAMLDAIINKRCANKSMLIRRFIRKEYLMMQNEINF